MSPTKLIYASRQDGISADDLDRLLTVSRNNNLRDGITGALVVEDGFFLQLLEGERAAVAKTFMRIMQDNRHEDIQVVSAHDSTQRMFVDWSMHFIQASMIKQDILSPYLIDGAFIPTQMSEQAVDDLCRALADGDEEVMAG